MLWEFLPGASWSSTCCRRQLHLLLWGLAAGIPTAVFAEAGLSFLGMGVRPPRPSWGQMLAESGSYWQYWPHMFIFPSMMITLSVLAFQGIADGLRKALDVNENI